MLLELVLRDENVILSVCFVVFIGPRRMCDRNAELLVFIVRQLVAKLVAADISRTTKNYRSSAIWRLLVKFHIFVRLEIKFGKT